METMASRLFRKPDVAGNIGGWQERHMSAVLTGRGFERPIVRMIEHWLRYADLHQQRYESKIGDDGVLGQHWEQIGVGLLGLLNGETGNLDCGTLDGLIRDAMKDCGVEVTQ